MITDKNQVTGSTQSSFLQHAAYIDTSTKQLCVLCEVNRCFVVSPNVEALLVTMENMENQQAVTGMEGLDDLIVMDTT